MNEPFKTRKLWPRYIGYYQNISQVGEVAYQLEFLTFLYKLNGVFHVSQPCKFVSDPLQPILQNTIEVAADLTFNLQPSLVVYYVVKLLKNKDIPLIKLL